MSCLAPRPDPAVLAALAAGLERLGGGAPSSAPAGRSVALGIDAIDRALPSGGLPAHGLHEVLAADRSAAAVGFAALLLARFAGDGGVVGWCRRTTDLYGPALAAFGLDSARLLVVRARTDTEIVWAMEEGLRSGVLAAVLGEATAVSPIAARRLQLAAETHATAALLLRPFGTATAATPALTRWRIGSIAGGAATVPAAVAAVRPRWQVALVRCRSGGAGLTTAAAGQAAAAAPWLLDWCDEESGFVVAADLRHRPADAALDVRAAV